MYEDEFAYGREQKKSPFEKADNVVYLIDGMLNTPTKRHIVGGILLSVSFLFGGLAITAMTIKEDENEKRTDSIC